MRHIRAQVREQARERRTGEHEYRGQSAREWSESGLRADSILSPKALPVIIEVLSRLDMKACEVYTRPSVA